MNALSQFLDLAPRGTGKVLEAFALAECLTDHVANLIYAAVAIPGLDFEEFVSALRYASFYEPRNSEWNIANPVRQDLSTTCYLSDAEKIAIHGLLLDAAAAGDPAKAGWETPHYLFSDAGLAFHKAGAGDLPAALAHYSKCARGAFRGNQWLGAKFAERQELDGTIPAGMIETMFLRAMVLLRTGARGQALPMLRKIATSTETKLEVAIALHIIGNDDATKGRFGEAEAAYMRSIGLRQALKDTDGLAQTEHSLGNLYAREMDFAKADAAYARSIKLRSELNDAYGLAQTENSRAKMYVQQKRFDEAEDIYRHSMELGEAIHHHHHVAKVAHGLANLYARTSRFDAAEAMYLRSTAALRKIGDKKGIAQTLHSHANMLLKSDPLRAAEMLKESLQLDRSISNQSGVDMVMRTMKRLQRHVGVQELDGQALALPDELQHVQDATDSVPGSLELE